MNSSLLTRSTTSAPAGSSLQMFVSPAVLNGLSRHLACHNYSTKGNEMRVQWSRAKLMRQAVVSRRDPDSNRRDKSTAPVLEDENKSIEPSEELEQGLTQTKTEGSYPVEYADDVVKGALVDVTVDLLAYGGKAVCILKDKFVIMTSYAIPGEKLRLRIQKKKKNFAEGAVVTRLEPSPSAIQPPCSYFGPRKCGGCATQNYSYEDQLQQKTNQVSRLFRLVELGLKTEIEKSENVLSMLKKFPEVRPMIACDQAFEYRNKMEFAFSNRVWIPDNSYVRVEKGVEEDVPSDFVLGLRPQGRFDKVMDIEKCYLQDQTSNDILNFVRGRTKAMGLIPYDNITHVGFIRHLMIRSSTNASNDREYMINFVTSIDPDTSTILKSLAEEVVNRFPTVVSVLQSMTKTLSGSCYGEQQILLHGRPYIEQVICGLTFEISANSFFQTNPSQGEVLYKQVIKAASLTGSEIVHDLFCGTGSIGLCLASGAKRVFGVELVESAVADAKKNMVRNGITNAEFHLGNLDNIREIINKLPPADVVVVDPPRAGCHKSLMKHLAATKPKKIVYVSCNPATQVRDILILCEMAPQFKVTSIQPVDMHPHTASCENIVTLDFVDS